MANFTLGAGEAAEGAEAAEAALYGGDDPFNGLGLGAGFLFAAIVIGVSMCAHYT